MERSTSNIRGGEIVELIVETFFGWIDVWFSVLISVFDPNEKSDGQNPEHVNVHEEYKNLVNEMCVMLRRHKL